MDFLRVPLGPIPTSRRWQVVLGDRKGLEDFNSRLARDSEHIDYRRVLGHAIRNIAWAESGHYPGTTTLALDRHEKDWEEVVGCGKDAILRTLHLDYRQARADSEHGMHFVREVVRSAIAYGRRRLDDVGSAGHSLKDE